MAFNVINKEAVRDFLSHFALDESTRAHLMTALEKPLLQREENLRRVERLPRQAPQWLVSKWNNGTVFHEFVSDNIPPDKIAHIRDWIKGAMLNNADWTHKTDQKGRPRKLLKLATIEQAYAEADKAMKLQAETLRNKFGQNTNFEAEEANGDIETIMSFEDGHRIVRMLTPAALKKETAFMGHCIGQGAYDEAVQGDELRFYSLPILRWRVIYLITRREDLNVLSSCRRG